MFGYAHSGTLTSAFMNCTTAGPRSTRGPASSIRTFTPDTARRAATSAPEIPAPTITTSASTIPSLFGRLRPIARHATADAHRLAEGHRGPYIGVGVQHELRVLSDTDYARIPRRNEIVSEAFQAAAAKRGIELRSGRVSDDAG